MTSPSTYIGPSELFRLLWGGLRLKYSVYSEVRQSPDSLRLCLTITILAGAAYGVQLAVLTDISPALLAVVWILIVMGQLLFESAVVWAIGAGLLRRSVRFGEVLRPLALARAPQVAYAALALVEVPSAVNFAVAIWLLIAFAVAIRAALESGWLLTLATVAAIFLAEVLAGRAGSLIPS
jgi:hypothetical protein